MLILTTVGAVHRVEGRTVFRRGRHPAGPDAGAVVFAQLVPLSGGEPITIDKDVTVVGRQAEHCDLVLDRKSVSKIHCIIARTDGLLFVRDLDSTNGTKVNGQRIVRGALLPGDQLAFAGEKFRVHLGPSPVPAAARSAQRTEELEAAIPESPEDFGDESTSRRPSRPDAAARESEDLVE
jgi:predicted component of type VI protein secretion system